MNCSDWRNGKLKLVIMHWRSSIYVGHLKEIAPEYSKEIVLVCKTFNPVENRLLEIVRTKDHEELYVDDLIDFHGRYHLARKLGSKLTFLTPEQELYMSSRMLRVYEMMLEDSVLGD